MNINSNLFLKFNPQTKHGQYNYLMNPFRRGKRTAKRWYETPNHHEKEALGYSTSAGFDAQLPAEWESWLRYRR